MSNTIQEVGDGNFVDEGVTYDVQANIELSWLSPDQSGALAESFGGFPEFPATADEAVHTGASLDHFETVIQHNPAMDVDEQAEVARIRADMEALVAECDGGSHAGKRLPALGYNGQSRGLPAGGNVAGIGRYFSLADCALQFWWNYSDDCRTQWLAAE